MIVVKPIVDSIIWDDFLSQTQPNTFLHSWQWGEFQQAMGERIWRLGIYENTQEHEGGGANGLIGIALIIKVQARRGNFLFCPHGPIGMKTWKHDNMEALGAYMRTIAHAEKCSFVRFSPLMPKTPGNEELWRDVGFREAPIHMHPELAWLLDITPSTEALLTGMRKTTRYSIRKAEKDGVEIKRSTNPDDIDKFWEIYSATVDRQRFVPFSKKYLRAEFEIFAAKSKAVLLFGSYKGEVISTAYIIFEKWSGFYHHGASVQKYTNVPASQLVQWHAILEAKKRGCLRYNFWGIVPESAKNHPWAGLSTFKRGFGGYFEEYTHAKDLVLTSRYWINYLVENIRRRRRGL